MQNKKLVAGILMAIMLVLPVVAFGQLPDPTVPVSGTGLDFTEIEGIINTIARFLIVISLVIAVIFIVWGGIAWMMAGANEDAAGKAKTRIINGIIGAAVVLAVGVILQTLSSLITRAFFS